MREEGVLSGRGRIHDGMHLSDTIITLGPGSWAHSVDIVH